MDMEIQNKVYTQGTTATRERGLLQPFAIVAGFVALALMASSTPTPLYSVYAAQWHFSPLTVTEVYGVYAIGVLLALLLTGGLSDLIGRRPVMISALLGLVGAESIFMVAGGLDWLFVARSIQGLATGLLLGATGAALVDLHPRRDGAQAGLANGIASASGIGLGALVSGLLVEYVRYREVTPFVVIALLAALGAWAAWRLPETVDSHGARFSLTPRAPRVPRALWRTFGLSGLGVLAAWSVGGLYFSLGPALIQQLHHTTNHAVGGIFVGAFAGCAVLAQWVLRQLDTRPTVVGGSALLAVGSVGTAAAVSAGSLDGFLLGSLVVGFGFGATFMGAVRALAAVLPPAHRAGVMAAFFVVAYFAISVPAIAAGIATVHIGLESAATWFGLAVAAVAALVSIIGWFELRPTRPSSLPTPASVPARARARAR
jgi:MFS family permease